MSGNANPAPKEEARWQKTKHANLVRYVPSGTLFARIRVRGKLIRQSLKTGDLAVARRKLIELEKQERSVAEDQRNGKLTFKDALEEFRQRGYRGTLHGRAKRLRKPLKPRTRAYYEERIKMLLASWPGLETILIRNIAAKDCEAWADEFMDGASPSVYNHTISILRHILGIGVENGARYDNPASGLGRASERPKKLQLPSTEQFEQFVQEIENSGGRFSKPCADLVRFLAYGGFRKSEAANITWADCDFAKSTIMVWGDPEGRTKNGEFRAIPMIQEMKTFLEGLRAGRPHESKDTPVMEVRECQKAMDRAASVVGMSRITHHDLRHLFATRCIESGVDIPTVSRWLGHKDGGALAMKVYGHLRDQHSLAMAKMVRFGAAAPHKNES